LILKKKKLRYEKFVHYIIPLEHEMLNI